MPDKGSPAGCVQALRGRLESSEADHQIELSVRREELRSGQVKLIDLVLGGAESRIMILGNPGAGKTTLVKGLCLSYLREPMRTLPVFIELKDFSTARSVRRAYEDAVAEMNAGRETAYPIGLVVLDGMNEVPEGSLQQALQQIENFSADPDMEHIPIILTCRELDFSGRAGSFQRYVVVPISRPEAQRFLEKRLGFERAHDVWERLPARMREFCASPLLLNMVATVLFDDDTADDALPGNRSELYKRFLQRLDDDIRQRTELQTPEYVREYCLGFIAYSMNNIKVSVQAREIRQLLGHCANPAWGIPPATLQREVLEFPPIGVGHRDRLEPPRSRSFMHQSFQEYYTALHINLVLSERDPDRLRLRDIASVLGKDSWRETVCFLSGMLSDSTELVRLCRKQGNAALAASCIEHSRSVDTVLVDEFLQNTLDAFKYGDRLAGQPEEEEESFPYRLISLLLQVLDKRSPDFPQRVVNDIAYWADKYSRYQPQELAKDLSVEALVTRARGGPIQDRIDAVWTLSRRAQPESVHLQPPGELARAVPLLEMLAASADDQDSLLREYSVVALGSLAEERSFRVLSAIAVDRGNSRWIRGYALHAIGKYANPDAVDVLLGCVESPEDQDVADDAAWALSEIAENAPHLVRPALPKLFMVLDSAADRYTKGCILYVLGRGKFTEAIGQMIDYMGQIDDPYILEDGCRALAELGATQGMGLLSRIAEEPDPMTRRQAQRALRQLAAAN